MGATGAMPGMQLVLERQATLWASSMEKAEQRWLNGGAQEKAAAMLQQALDASLTRFGQRIAETEKKLLERNQAILEGFAKLAAGMKENGRDHQLALARLTDAVGLSVEMVSKTQASEAQLVRLQESLSQNLALLANSTTFEQAVESLTAAIHLLTTRVNPSQPAMPRIMPMKHNAA